MESAPSSIDHFIAATTMKDRPRVCSMSTPSGDSVDMIERFYAAFEPLGCEAYRLRTEGTDMNRTNLSVYCLVLSLIACASQPAQVTVPASLVPVNEHMVERVTARGVQIYECRAAPDNVIRGAAWTLLRGEAELFDSQGRGAGKHYYSGGPAWEASDGSKFVGSVKARADAPQKGALQWLLLSTRSVGKDGRFSKITSLQRVNTTGGIAPASGCDTKSLGATERVPFTADYVLFTN